MTRKENRILSIRLRNGHYALLQMLQKGQVAVFNCFRSVDEWSDLQLSKESVLFTCILLRSVLARSAVTIHKDVSPVPGLTYSEERIDIGDGFREVTVWEGTEDERTFLMMGVGKNCVRRIDQAGVQIREHLTPIALADYQRVAHLELTNLCDYPTFNERLYLCELLGRNIDPLKEIAFSRPLDRACRVYVDIIAGKTRLSELGY